MLSFLFALAMFAHCWTPGASSQSRAIDEINMKSTKCEEFHLVRICKWKICVALKCGGGLMVFGTVDLGLGIQRCSKWARIIWGIFECFSPLWHLFRSSHWSNECDYGDDNVYWRVNKLIWIRIEIVRKFVIDNFECSMLWIKNVQDQELGHD